MNNRYKDCYSENDFWKKIRKYAKKAGKELVLNVLKLYYAMALGKASPKQIATIIGALGYFISPIDAIPDVTPGIGFLDDGGVIALAVATLACCSDPEVVAAANAKLKEWFD
mgnify:FL=1